MLTIYNLHECVLFRRYFATVTKCPIENSKTIPMIRISSTLTTRWEMAIWPTWVQITTNKHIVKLNAVILTWLREIVRIDCTSAPCIITTNYPLIFLYPSLRDSSNCDVSCVISKARCESTKSARCCARDTINISVRIIGRTRSMPDPRKFHGLSCLSS